MTTKRKDITLLHHGHETLRKQRTGCESLHQGEVTQIWKTMTILVVIIEVPSGIFFRQEIKTVTSNLNHGNKYAFLTVKRIWSLGIELCKYVCMTFLFFFNPNIFGVIYFYHTFTQANQPLGRMFLLP